MDKNAIKKYAVWARTELITRVSQRAEKYDITAEADANASSVNGVLLSDAEKKQRKALIEQVKQKGVEQVMEEVAYTWFNRFIALRFMEVNGYLPSHIRVFTDDNNEFKPQILAEAIHLELDGLDMEKVYEMKNNNENDELYKYLIIVQCNDLSKILPGMFQKISDYTELLFPDNILREGSVIEQMVAQIGEKDWDVSEGGQIEILGWLYQFYISEKHEAVVDPLHGKVVAKDEVPAATALFTTDWVVRYIIDNSVGRYWIERNPESNLKNELEYFVTPKDGNIPTVDEKITPEELTVLDPSMGSAHFGVYAFDVLMKIYMEYGVSERDAAASIVKNNLFGLDIDDRSAQIAYFAIMMKARQYDRRFFSRDIQPNFYSIQESNNIDTNTVEYFANGDAGLKADIESILHDLNDAKEYGSIIQVNPVNFDALFTRFEEIKEDINISKDAALNHLLPLVQIAKVMSDKYVVVATNPPYLNKYDEKLKAFVNEKYKEYSGDLFSIFIYRNFLFCRKNGYSGFMTPFVWMFISSYERLRKLIIDEKTISTLIQFEYSAFEDATIPICSFVLKNQKPYSNIAGMYFRLSDFVGGMGVQRNKVIEAIENRQCDYLYETNQNLFNKIEGSPIAYWVSDGLFDIFANAKTIKDYADAKVGLQTGENNLFLRMWYEVDDSDINFTATSEENALASQKKWFPYNKGGAYRKWYGNNDFIVNWENDGYEIKHFVNDKGKLKSRPQNTQFYFKEAITWSYITSAAFSARIKKTGFIFDVSGVSLFVNDAELRNYILALLCSKVASFVTKIINPTLNMQVGDIQKIPVVYDETLKGEVNEIVNNCIEISKEDWDSFETSWEFKRHPFIQDVDRIQDAYELWVKRCNERFLSIKENEERLNSLFLEKYHLDDKLTPIVDDDSISVNKANLGRDIRSFISYAVGCMFGRYSLDKEGVVCTHVNLNSAAYTSYIPDPDNIIPICDDEYFEDDIVGRFTEFVKKVYGEEKLEENLQFIADGLDGNGLPRDVIRNYFINDFYSDHIKIYQKRPIYWLFDSGKKNGFKCLIYLHRYQSDTIARIRTDYVHEQQSRYRTAIEETENRLLSASGSDKVKLDKKLKKLRDQNDEIHVYEEKIHHLADQMISIDLDDGVKLNYAKFQEVLAKIK